MGISVSQIDQEFRSAKLKVQNALAHSNRLDREIAAYLYSAGTHISLEQFPGRPVWLHILHINPSIPDELSLIASDATSNLRQSLDHAACAVSRSIGKTDKGVWFPFGKDEADLERQIADKAKKLPESVKQYVRDLSPTPRGNALLHALHELNLSDKHRQLFTLEITVPKFGGQLDLSTFRYSMLDQLLWNADENSLAFATTTYPHSNYKLWFELTLRFDVESDLAESPASSLLQFLVGYADEIIEGLARLTREHLQAS